MTPTLTYIERCTAILHQMLAERDQQGRPVWIRPGQRDRSDDARRFHDEMCYRLRLSGEGATQLRMAIDKEKK